MNSQRFDVSLIIFDLDGTLLDSSQYASKAIHAAFHKMIVDYPAIPVPSEAAITAQIGKPMQEFYRGLLPKAHQDLWAELHEHAAANERDFLASGADFLFEGTRETLTALKRSGKILAIASNCSQDYLDAIADAYELDRYFAQMKCVGRGDKITKAMLVENLVERFAPDGRAVMIGDRVHDHDAARVSGIPFVGCRYGFAASNEWLDADATIEAMPELLEMIE